LIEIKIKRLYCSQRWRDVQHCR